ncbi:hypothetical protein SAY87_005978 [Trapa incisa]|uniref:AB hydrolase-1 domain-containing protein n=2 Tax=Trapa TaxID=22665 RepID=A0AAN7QMZ2_TRANT|nr:hypothetical protein SAY87_005978 [Trapa incisa]KAK4772021.1 hypothetical protein SAY86_013796 [Trapa natans]
MGAHGGYLLEKLRRIIRTAFFVVAMVASLLASSLPLLVSAGDVLALCILVSNFTCLSCYSFKEHLRRYAFKSSLTDIPLVSIVRSLIITCVYLMCDGAALSQRPYLGIVSLCSFISILLLSIKACVFSMNSQMEAEASSYSPSRQRLHLKKSWGMPVLFLSSVVFALGHIVVAYRTSCRARRKLMFYRMDPEAVSPLVLSCKSIFSGHHKIPRSPTPTMGKNSKCAKEMKRKNLRAAFDEGEAPIRALADADSSFISCKGLVVHYKISLPHSPPQSYSSMTLIDPNISCSTPHTAMGRLQIDRHPFTALSDMQHNLQRSYSIQINGSSLYRPLLDESVTSPVPSEEIPVFIQDDHNEDSYNLNTFNLDQEKDGRDQSGIVLVHGFGGGVFSWRHVMGFLAQQANCPVAAFDRPGWGLTSRPRRKDWEEKELPNPYKLENQVDLLLSFCSEMGFSSVILVGHDDGGLLVLKAAQSVQTSSGSFNVAIKGVVLLNVSLSREVVPGFARILLHTSLRKKHLVRPLLRTEVTQVVNRRAWYDAAKLTPEVLSLYKAPLRVEGWDEALHEVGRLSYETVLSPQNAAELLKAVKDLPVLVIAGAEDVLVPLKSSQSMASKFVNSRLVSISGCGHLPHEECPNALLAAISPFIIKLASSEAEPENK